LANVGPVMRTVTRWDLSARSDCFMPQS
jgi:hypothetical protein